MEQIRTEMTLIATEIHVYARSIPVIVVLTTLLLGLVRGRALSRARLLRCGLIAAARTRAARGERVRAQQQQSRAGLCFFFYRSKLPLPSAVMAVAAMCVVTP